MDILIYAKEDEDTLREIATADPDEADGNVAMLIDLLLDQADEDFESRSFRVFTAEGVVDVEVNGDDYVNPRRDITVTHLDEGEEAVEEDEEEEEEAPKRKPGRPKGSGKKRGRPKG